MRKGFYVIFTFIMAVGASQYAHGQQEDTVLTLPVTYHIQSNYIASAFPMIPSPLSVMKDSLGPPMNILNVVMEKGSLIYQ